MKQTALKNIEDEEFDGEGFLELTESDLKQFFKFGTVKKLSKIIKEVSLRIQSIQATKNSFKLLLFCVVS